jgi:hypothetical protein
LKKPKEPNTIIRTAIRESSCGLEELDRLVSYCIIGKRSSIQDDVNIILSHTDEIQSRRVNSMTCSQRQSQRKRGVGTSILLMGIATLARYCCILLTTPQKPHSTMLPLDPCAACLSLPSLLQGFDVCFRFGNTQMPRYKGGAATRLPRFGSGG